MTADNLLATIAPNYEHTLAYDQAANAYLPTMPLLALPKSSLSLSLAANAQPSSSSLSLSLSSTSSSNSSLATNDAQDTLESTTNASLQSMKLTNAAKDG